MYPSRSKLLFVAFRISGESSTTNIRRSAASVVELTSSTSSVLTILETNDEGVTSGSVGTSSSSMTSSGTYGNLNQNM
eukprot:CAMPEP_0114421052 /NCGR_PEP_ID=MMETSP0103-20121206/4877_1 /TAXON_ID=37642 ORGANISM="Paraphysomonas imperforata, Strain PA2" /NCGR_SAMPLE_ID=MMETSP0103 /ASSEMBLY_ACC=CAM_ASM_000201 /LENGTH=77 /DNA_ID=CAMNT_0001589557 /DNA_START=34 /DNA_END=264 /DNA_ORIENTATION=+